MVTIPLPFFLRGRIKIPVFTIVYSALLFAVDRSFYTALTLLAAAIHELGHLSAARLLGIGTEQITIYPFGADIRLSAGLRSYRADFFISSAGIVANCIVGILCYAFFCHNIYLNYFSLCNFLLAGINLFPLPSLTAVELYAR